MSSESAFTKDNLDLYLKELGKEYRKRSGKKVPAEIILVGGAAILANYGFRDVTYDIDAIILASSVMKEVIKNVGDRFELPHNWLNADFKKTASFTNKLFEVSVYYRTFSNILTVRIIAAEYLIAMKLISGRQYKHDLSDIAGILWEHKKSGSPILKSAVDKAIAYLYGADSEIPQVSKELIEDAFSIDDYEKVYNEIRQNEKQAKEILLVFQQPNPNGLKGENINDIIEKARKKKLEEQGN